MLSEHAEKAMARAHFGRVKDGHLVRRDPTAWVFDGLAVARSEWHHFTGQM